MTTPLFTFRQVPTIATMLEARGINPLELLRASELPDDALKGEITAPLSRIQDFIDRCAQRLDEPVFGIELASQIPKGRFGVTEFVVRASPTVRHALTALCELSPLVNPLLDMRYIADQRGCEVRTTFAALRDGLGMHLNEFSVAYVATQFMVVLGEALPLERAWFSHARREHADAVAKRLRCNVSFQAADCGFAVASDVIAREPPSADAALYDFLLAQARTQLSNMGRHDIVAQVVRAIEARMTNGDLTAASIADALSTTQRSLQRHLADAGTSFREVLVRVRQRRRSELARGGLTDSEIAARLGFANARSMRRSLDEPEGED